MAIGALLIYKGRTLLVQAGDQIMLGDRAHLPLFSLFEKFTSDVRQASLFMVMFAFLIGYMKGRFVLRKPALRISRRIRSFEGKIPLRRLYTVGYLCLIGGMMGLGMTMRFLPIPVDVRGFIDFTIGIALLSGALQFALIQSKAVRS